VAWIATDPTRSKVVGKVGVALPPTAPGVIEDARAGKGYIGYYDGGALGIPTSSRNKEAALLFIQWVTRKEVQGEFAKAAARIVRKSTFTCLLCSQKGRPIGHIVVSLRVLSVALEDGQRSF